MQTDLVLPKRLVVIVIFLMNLNLLKKPLPFQQTQTLREFFEDLQVEENRIKREIQRIGQKIKRLENSNVDKKDNDNKTDGK